MKVLRNWLWTGAVGLWLSAKFVSAVQVIPLSIEELTGRADVVVRATVTAKECRQDDKGRIITEIEMKVSEGWKGPISEGIIKVVHGGGILGERRMRVSGQVEYRVGEEIVAFLIRGPQGQLLTVGLDQGKFEIWKESAAGAELARSHYHGNDPSSGGDGPAKSALTSSTRLTLELLKRRVQGAQGGAR